MTTETSNIQKNFFIKLKDGDFGLAKTYWLFGVLVSIIYRIFLELALVANSIGIIYAANIALIVYSYFHLFGLWNSADRYTGKKVWAFLAKVAVVLGVIQVIGLIALVLGMI